MQVLTTAPTPPSPQVRQHLLRFQAEHAIVARQQQDDKTMSDAMRQEAARMQLGLSYRRRHEQIQTQQELIRALQVGALIAPDDL